MKIDLNLSKFKNKQPTTIKEILWFNEKVLKNRLIDFYRYEKTLKKISNDELKNWIKLFKTNSETEINIKIKMDKFEVEINKALNTKSKLIFILHNLLELAFLRTSDSPQEDRGKIVRDFKESEVIVEEKTITPKVVEKLSRKEMLVLKKG